MLKFFPNLQFGVITYMKTVIMKSVSVLNFTASNNLNCEESYVVIMQHSHTLSTTSDRHTHKIAINNINQLDATITAN